MDNRVWVKDAVMTIRLPEEVDHFVADRLREEAGEILVERNVREVVFDFRKTVFMDSSGIGLVMGRFREMELIGGKVRAVHVGERMRMMRERMKTEEKMRWNTMTLEFESRPCNESFARVSAAAFLAQLNPTVEEVADVKTAISEAVTNAMIHGYRQEKGKIQMKCVLDLEEKVFQVTVKDTGVGIENVEKAMEPMFTTCPELERSGMGFSFMEAFMDELEVRSHPGWGTEVVMKRKIGVHPEM